VGARGHGPLGPLKSGPAQKRTMQDGTMTDRSGMTVKDNIISLRTKYHGRQCLPMLCAACPVDPSPSVYSIYYSNHNDRS